MNAGADRAVQRGLTCEPAAVTASERELAAEHGYESYLDLADDPALDRNFRRDIASYRERLSAAKSAAFAKP